MRAHLCTIVRKSRQSDCTLHTGGSFGTGEILEVGGDADAGDGPDSSHCGCFEAGRLALDAICRGICPTTKMTVKPL